MPGMNGVMTVWTDSGKTKIRIYLALFQQAYTVYCELNGRE